jgi:hypothetical protein
MTLGQQANPPRGMPGRVEHLHSARTDLQSVSLLDQNVRTSNRLAPHQSNQQPVVQFAQGLRLVAMNHNRCASTRLDPGRRTHVIRVRMGAHDPANLCITFPDPTQYLARLGSRVDQHGFSRRRFGNQIAEDPESAYPYLIDLEIHAQGALSPSSSRKFQKRWKMYFFLDIRKSYKIDYKDIIMIGKFGIIKLLILTRGGAMSHHIQRGGIFSREITEKTVQKWRMLQFVAILPLLLSVVLLFRFKGSILGTIVFFLILIIGILLPQIYRDLIQSHLILREEIEASRGKEAAKDS